MSSTRLLQPLARVAQRQPLVVRSINRPVFATALNTQASRQPVQSKFNVPSHTKIPEQSTNLAKPFATTQKQDVSTIRVYAAMPQLIPYFFVNETVANFGAIVVLIYFMSKYALPNKLRIFLARLFISKL